MEGSLLFHSVCPPQTSENGGLKIEGQPFAMLTHATEGSPSANGEGASALLEYNNMEPTSVPISQLEPWQASPLEYHHALPTPARIFPLLSNPLAGTLNASSHASADTILAAPDHNGFPAHSGTAYSVHDGFEGGLSGDGTRPVDPEPLHEDAEAHQLTVPFDMTSDVPTSDHSHIQSQNVDYSFQRYSTSQPPTYLQYPRDHTHDSGMSHHKRRSYNQPHPTVVKRGRPSFSVTGSHSASPASSRSSSFVSTRTPFHYLPDSSTSSISLFVPSHSASPMSESPVSSVPASHRGSPTHFGDQHFSSVDRRPKLRVLDAAGLFTWDGKRLESASDSLKSRLKTADMLFKQSLLLKHMFPEAVNILSEQSAMAWHRAQEIVNDPAPLAPNHDIEDYFLSSSRSWRSKRVKKVRSAVIPLFKLDTFAPNIRRQAAKTLSEDANFCFASVEIDESLGNIRVAASGIPLRIGELDHPCIETAVIQIAFDGPTSPAAKEPNLYYPAIPLTVIAFACVAIKYALQLEVASDPSETEFKALIYVSHYHAYMDYLRDYSSAHPVECLALQKALWERGATHADILAEVVGNKISVNNVMSPDEFARERDSLRHGKSREPVTV